jgi:hypothetical protein
VSTIRGTHPFVRFALKTRLLSSVVALAALATIALAGAAPFQSW